MTDTTSAADALKHPLTIEKSTDDGLYSLWQGSAYTGIATKNHVFLAELVTAYNRGLDTRAAAPQEVDIEEIVKAVTEWWGDELATCAYAVTEGTVRQTIEELQQRRLIGNAQGRG